MHMRDVQLRSVEEREREKKQEHRESRVVAPTLANGSGSRLSLCLLLAAGSRSIPCRRYRGQHSSEGWYCSSLPTLEGSTLPEVPPLLSLLGWAYRACHLETTFPRLFPTVPALGSSTFLGDGIREPRFPLLLLSVGAGKLVITLPARAALLR